MSITDRLKFIARSYLNSAKKRGKRLLDEAGLDPIDTSSLSDDELEREIRRKVEAELAREEKTGRTARPFKKKKAQKRRQSKTTKRKLAQCYANLELSPGATVDEIHKAWRKLILKYHPDRYPGDKAKMERATRITQIINESYNTLLDHLDADKKP